MEKQLRISALVLVYALFTSPANADVHIVPTHYKTIQAAAFAASDGDEIHVLPGEYDGFDVFVDVTVIGLGASPSDTTIKGLVRSYEQMHMSNLHLTGGWIGNGTARGDSLTDCVVSSVGVEHSLGFVSFTRCNFIRCQGSALTLTLGVYPFEDCKFIENSTDAGGGAIHVDDSYVKVHNCEFRDNSAALNGGAIDAASPSLELLVTNSSFEGNSAGGLAGAIWYQAGNAGSCHIESSLFENNSSDSTAGAVYIRNGQFLDVPGNVVSCEFRHNTSADAPESAALCFVVQDIQPLPYVGYTSFCGNTPADIHGEHITIRNNMFNKHCPCPADTNGDGMLTPADFTAWINAFNNNLPECDQNGDGACTPTDFTAWIANFNAGC
ncbi:MAG: hypothetical protein ED559_00520 [Phycisphaera sp.]|nr:MAG: hypothetical protein ED559_00520 [Phycisphaera sp.]